MSALSFAAGDCRIDAIVDMDCFELPLARLLPGLDVAALAPARAQLEPDHVDFTRGVVRLGVHSFLIRTPERTVLVDACVGEHKERPVRPDWHRREDTGFLARLAAAGVAPEDIDVVLCTHLHADHVGWNTRLVDGRWVPTFPRARYLAGRHEFAHWQAMTQAGDAALVNHGSFGDSVLPVVEHGQMDLVDDGHDLAPGLVLMPLPGHSPGQMGLRLNSSGALMIFCGDAMHSPAQVLQPSCSSAFCADAAQAARTRLALLEETADSGAVLAPAHFRGSRRARILRRGDSFVPEFAV